MSNVWHTSCFWGEVLWQLWCAAELVNTTAGATPPQYQQMNQELRIHNEFEEPHLLLLRPSISEIFVFPSNSPPIDADVAKTASGLYPTKEMNKHVLESLSILCVSENGSVGYTIPMRFDLILCLEKLATSGSPPIDFPYGLFTNRDVIVVTRGFYTVQLLRNFPEEVIGILGHGGTVTDSFLASKIIYASTTTDVENMTNLRRLEATAKHLLTSISPKTTTLPKLPPEIASGWQHDFLEPIFKRAKAGKQ